MYFSKISRQTALPTKCSCNLHVCSISLLYFKFLTSFDLLNFILFTWNRCRLFQWTHHGYWNKRLTVQCSHLSWVGYFSGRRFFLIKSFFCQGFPCENIMLCHLLVGIHQVDWSTFCWHTQNQSIFHFCQKRDGEWSSVLVIWRWWTWVQLWTLFSNAWMGFDVTIRKCWWLSIEKYHLEWQFTWVYISQIKNWPNW